MGQQVDTVEFSPADRRRYREKLNRCLDALGQVLLEAQPGRTPLVGLELEVNLVGPDLSPSMNNTAVLAAIDDPRWQSELGRFNVEVNAAPRDLADGGLAAMRDELQDALTQADAAARTLDTRLLPVGILPTLRREDVDARAISEGARYAALNDQILAARGEPIHLHIDGPEPLEMLSDSVAPEAACTSMQIHVDMAPEDFAAYWNAAQAIAGIQLALGANSPLLFGRRLWAETRVPLFEQSTDTRPAELAAQGVRPRVWFSERWIDSAVDLFAENIRYFPALLPICTDSDPLVALANGEAPALSELCLHNGTIYRWNRPVYATANGKPSLRVENRVLPSGPTVADTVANAAFAVGLIRGLAQAEVPVWTHQPYGAALSNFRAGARDGIDARLRWPGRGELCAVDLVRTDLLNVAAAGLDSWGVGTCDRDEVLGIVEGRCAQQVNGASWQLAVLDRYEARGFTREAALRETTACYLDHVDGNQPVHTWGLPN